jgi:hypothetical protein
MHNAAKAWKQKLCILIATLEAGVVCCWNSGLTTESLAVNKLKDTYQQ